MKQKGLSKSRSNALILDVVIYGGILSKLMRLFGFNLKENVVLCKIYELKFEIRTYHRGGQVSFDFL